MKTRSLVLYLIAATASAQDCLTVSGPRVRASDLASRVPAFASVPGDLDLLPAPVVGVIRQLRPTDWDALARRTGLALAPQELCLVQATRSISGEEWRSLLGRRLSEYGVTDDWELLDTSRNPVPAGEIEFAASGLSRIGPDRYLWRGRVHGAAAPGFSVWVRFEARPKRPALVSKEDLRAGTPLSRDSIAIESRPGSLTDGPPLTLVAAPNSVLRRSVRRGEEIRAADIARPILVRQGERTQVTVSGSGADLSFEANALQSGQLGQFVLVENPINRRRFRAEVIAPSAVAVHAGRKERD